MAKEGTKTCKYCKSEIPADAKICPNCRKKQGGIGKWIIIGIVVLLIICIAGGGNDKDNSSSNESSSSEATVADSGTVDESETDTKDVAETSDEKDNSLGTPLSIYDALETNELVPYEMSEKAKTFLTEHEELFPASGDIDKSLIDEDLDHRQILKNASKYGDKLMNVPYAAVVQITEEEITDGKYLTSVNLTDGDQQYYVLYIGELDKVYEDSYVSVTGLPLGISQFDNTDGGQTIVIVLAGVSVAEVAE